MRGATMAPAVLALLASPAFAQSGTEGLVKCRQITEAVARLKCYDALPLAPPAPSAPTLQQQTEQFGQTRPAPSQTTTEDFGRAPQRAPEQLSEIETRVTGRFAGWAPGVRIRLDNGQVWQVTDDSARMYNLNNPKVVIRRGMLGAFYMNVEGDNRTVRVRRVE